MNEVIFSFQKKKKVFNQCGTHEIITVLVHFLGKTNTMQNARHLFNFFFFFFIFFL
jgi:hypothetical protein